MGVISTVQMPETLSRHQPELPDDVFEFIWHKLANAYKPIDAVMWACTCRTSWRICNSDALKQRYVLACSFCRHVGMTPPQLRAAKHLPWSFKAVKCDSFSRLLVTENLCVSVTHLDVSFNELGDIGCVAIARAVSSCMVSNVLVLNISNNK